MPVRYGKCINFGLCSKADSKAVQTVPDGQDFLCGESYCRKPLRPSAPPQPVSYLVPALIVGGVLLLLIGIGGFLAFRLRSTASARDQGISSTIPQGPRKTPALVLSGSNTIGAELAPALVKAWLQRREAADIRVSPGDKPDETQVTAILAGSPVTIEVRAHGSKTAFTDLGASSADIGMASRKVSDDELSTARLQGIGDLSTNASEHVVGLDGIAVIVNSAKGVDQFSREDLAKIFSGEIKGSWNLYARDDKSGTYDTFKTLVLGSRPLSKEAKRIEDSKALAAAVANDPNGIGFVGLPYASGVKKLAISDHGTRPLLPNTITVRTESYLLTRRLYLYLPEGAKSLARDFVNFALSDAGQDVVENAGFVSQKIATATPNETLSPDATKEYAGVVRGAERLTTDLRFRTGSAELDSKAVDDIDRIVRRLSDRAMAGRAIILIGFADNTGGRAANLKLSKDRAESVAVAFRRQGLPPATVTGLGPDMPVADNGTPEGREKNRRVEVWVKR